MFTLAAGGEMDPLVVFIVGAFLLVIAPILVIFMVIDFRRQLREQSTVRLSCAKCSYDLRAGHDRCPECGTCTNRRSIIETS